MNNQYNLSVPVEIATFQRMFCTNVSLSVVQEGNKKQHENENNMIEAKNKMVRVRERTRKKNIRERGEMSASENRKDLRCSISKRSNSPIETSK